MVRILMVEDNPEMRRLLFQVLKRDDVKIEIGENCYEAKCLLQEKAYDWVTLDLDLPDGSGVEVLQAIQLQYPDTKVIIISFGATDPAMKEQLLTLGAAAVLPKPFDPGELTGCIYGQQTP